MTATDAQMTATDAQMTATELSRWSFDAKVSLFVMSGNINVDVR
jgi:hypothetical protein